MSDLISRKAVLDEIHKYFCERIDHGIYEVDVVDCNAHISKRIYKLPTAFDVDKVVAQLESFKCSKEEAEKDMDKFIRNQHFDMCISIVKAGGWNKEKEAIE